MERGEFGETVPVVTQRLVFDGHRVVDTGAPTHCPHGHKLRPGRAVVNWNPSMLMQQIACLDCEDAGWSPAAWCIDRRWVTPDGTPIRTGAE